MSLPTAPVAIFWDYENQPCRKRTVTTTPERVIAIGRRYGRITAAKVYYDESLHLSPTRAILFKKTLENTGFEIVDCPHNNKKEVADKKMIVDIMAFALDHSTQATIVLYTADGDFVNTLVALHKRGYAIVLITPPHSVAFRNSVREACVNYPEAVFVNALTEIYSSDKVTTTLAPRPRQKAPPGAYTTLAGVSDKLQNQSTALRKPLSSDILLSQSTRRASPLSLPRPVRRTATHMSSPGVRKLMKRTAASPLRYIVKKVKSKTTILDIGTVPALPRQTPEVHPDEDVFMVEPDDNTPLFLAGARAPATPSYNPSDLVPPLRPLEPSDPQWTQYLLDLTFRNGIVAHHGSTSRITNSLSPLQPTYYIDSNREASPPVFLDAESRLSANGSQEASTVGLMLTLSEQRIARQAAPFAPLIDLLNAHRVEGKTSLNTTSLHFQLRKMVSSQNVLLSKAGCTSLPEYLQQAADLRLITWNRRIFSPHRRLAAKDVTGRVSLHSRLHSWLRKRLLQKREARQCDTRWSADNRRDSELSGAYSQRQAPAKPGQRAASTPTRLLLPEPCNNDRRRKPSSRPAVNTRDTRAVFQPLVDILERRTRDLGESNCHPSILECELIGASKEQRVAPPFIAAGFSDFMTYLKAANEKGFVDLRDNVSLAEVL